MIKYIILVFSFSLMSSMSFAQNYYELGHEEYLYGDVEKSIELFSKAIEEKQSVAKSYMLRGVAKGFLQDFYHAIEDLNNSKKIDSTDYYLFYCYGKVFVSNGFYNKGLEYLNTSISMNPKDEYVYDYRAATKLKLGDFKGAVKDGTVAIDLNPNVDYFYNARGFAKTELKVYNEAILDYDRALEIKKDASTYANKGYTYFLLGLYEKAIENYTLSLNIYPNDYDILYRRALAYKSFNQYDKVCLDLKKSSELKYAPAISLRKKFCEK